MRRGYIQMPSLQIENKTEKRILWRSTFYYENWCITFSTIIIIHSLQLPASLGKFSFSKWPIILFWLPCSSENSELSVTWKEIFHCQSQLHIDYELKRWLRKLIIVHTMPWMMDKIWMLCNILEFPLQVCCL